jgi:arylsulfatase A-like enzyme
MSPPNIVVLVSHDTGRHISPYGVATVRTPNAERLAREGVVFEQCYCAAPQCSPARAALFTGRPPHQNGVMGLTHACFAWDFNPGEVHLAQRLRDHGFATAAFGHQHETRRLDGRGFEHQDGANEIRTLVGRFDTWLGGRSEDRRPFYAQLACFQTHRDFTGQGEVPDASLGVTVPPWLDPTPDTRREFTALQGSVARWDEGLGDLLAVLDRRGLTGDTLLVVTTDHGLAMPRAKGTLYDPGIEVLLLLRWPGRLAAGRRLPALVSHQDVLPTLLEAVGATLPEGLDGTSLWPLLDGRTEAVREAVFFGLTQHEAYNPMRGLRTRRWKYIRNFEPGRGTPGDIIQGEDPRANTYRDHLQLLIAGRIRHQLHPTELYDLAVDPLERNNLAQDAAHAARCRGFARELLAWMERTGDPLLAGPIPTPCWRNALADLRAQAGN